MVLQMNAILPRFSFSVITNQSNDRLLLAGIAGEKWMLGFGTAVLVQDLYMFLFATNRPELQIKYSRRGRLRPKLS
jgi:hypothetical protein